MRLSEGDEVKITVWREGQLRDDDGIGEAPALTVLRAGESGLTVTAGGASKTLLVNAVHEAGVFRVSITQ